MRKNSPTASTARRGAKPSTARAISPISTSPRRSPERSSPTSPDALAVAPTGRDAVVRRVGVSRGVRHDDPLDYNRGRLAFRRDAAVREPAGDGAGPGPGGAASGHVLH